MRFSRRHTHREPPDLPMTSLIDVVFLLLVFFIITVSFLREQQLRSALQTQHQTSGRAADLRPQVVSVENRNGEPVFVIGQRVFRDRAALTDLLRALPKEGGVFIKVAGDVPVAAPAAALQASRDAGFIKVTYVPAG